LIYARSQDPVNTSDPQTTFDLGERFALVEVGSIHGIWDWDIQAGLLWLSDRTQELYGIRPGKQSRSMTEWLEVVTIHPDDLPRQAALVDNFLNVDAPHEGSWRVLHPDGVYRWVSVRGKRVCHENGTPIRAAGSVTDIDDYMKAQAALGISEERFSLAVEGSTDGIWDWNIVTDDMFFSERTQVLYGLRPGITTRKRQEWRQMVSLHPDDVQAQFDSLETYLTGGAPYDGQWRVRHADGDYRWIRIRGICVRDSHGRPTRMAGSVGDIHSQVLAQAALEASEQRFALAVAGSQDGIWDWNLLDDQLFMSEHCQELLGLEPGRASRSQQEWRTLVRIHPDDIRPTALLLSEYLKGGGSYDAKFRIGHPDDTYRCIRVRGICERDKSGQPTRMAGSVCDVEPYLRAEAALGQARRLEATGTLAGGIAHDFNNILAAILGFGEVALRDAPRGSRLHRDIEKILIAGERGRSLVDRILAFSRTGVAARAPVYVQGIVREAIDMLEATLPDRIELEVNLSAGRAATLSDSTQIHQVFMNLATNAVQAMPTGGKLRISLHTERLDRTTSIGTQVGPGEYIALKVSDEGPGIPAAIMDQIFDPFFTTKSASGGTGLGLALVDGIVGDLGGIVDVCTEVGRGTTFAVYLPREGEVRDQTSNGDFVAPRGNHEQVLIVDDEPALVTLMTDVLTGLGYVTVGFTVASEALAAFRAHPGRFDAIITDERMPEMSGAEFIGAVRAIRGAVPILLFSGFLDRTKAEASQNFGADLVLRKPVAMLELATTIAQLLETRKRVSRQHGAEAST
jgi:PAS domain S-box-containing protein